MRYLLDTHVLLWVVLKSDQLSNRARNLFTDRNNQITVSAASLWEISIKHSIGKLNLNQIAPKDFVPLCERLEITIIDLNPNLLVSSGDLPFQGNHRDPFDRMIIWTAISENIPVISRDKDYRLYEEHGLRIIW